MTALITYFLCNLLEKRYVIFIISWHCSLGGNFLVDTLRYLSWPALSRSWHLAASGMGLGVMSHQAGLLTTLHHIHICFPEQGGNMVTTMGWGFSDFRHLFCFTLLIYKAYMHHNHIPLMYIFNSSAIECWVSFSFKQDKDCLSSFITKVLIVRVKHIPVPCFYTLCDIAQVFILIDDI